MSFNTMHNDYLDPDRHLHQEEEEDEHLAPLLQALKPYDTGRWDWHKIDCTLTGKDADLEPWGQQGIEIVETSETTVKAVAHIGKSFAGDEVCLNMLPDQEEDDAFYEKAREAYLEQAYEIVCGCGVMGEWDGDSWYMYEAIPYEVAWECVNEEISYDETAQRLVEGAGEVLKPAEDELVLADRVLEMSAGWIDPDGNRIECWEESKWSAWAPIDSE
jgi:hypothetical protein